MHFISILIAGLLATQNVWAACLQDIDMQDHGILNVTMEDNDNPSEAVTVEYVKKLTGMRGDGVTMSRASASGLNWAEAHKYCSELESPAVVNERVTQSAIPHRVYKDWRLPTLGEWMGACYAQGTVAELLVEQPRKYYIANKIHPERIWTPKGVCQDSAQVDSEAFYWWINRHSTETEAGEDFVYDNPPDGYDPVYDVIAPEPDALIKSVRYGKPWAWNPDSANIKKVSGSETMQVRCVR